jgi:hypothetical protein
VSSGERNRRSPLSYVRASRTQLESWTEGGESPVDEVRHNELSKAGPEESSLNIPVPSGKAKYYYKTDSERVL